MNIISEQHKKELLEITENFPADIASLINYVDKTFKCHIHDLSLSDQKNLKFFIAKSFANQKLILVKLKNMLKIFYKSYKSYGKIYLKRYWKISLYIV
ncbi:hypothetical protein RHORCCE3_1553 [Rickettsia hoogstraalii str. RCCE3]|nr:hypothetical protein RHORCCE3_1553 [Rickettsia hoogstraalii str. RCCE3]